MMVFQSKKHESPIVLVVGAGNIGRRHLEGIINSQIDATIFVYDVDNANLQLTKKLVDNLYSNSLSINYVLDLESLPKLIDFCVVATLSPIRLSVLTSLVEVLKIDTLVLEKFLFPKSQEYFHFEKILKKHFNKVYVNTTRREMGSYLQLKEKCDKSQPFSINIHGKNWGMGTSLIHMLDLVAFISCEKNKPNLILDGLSKKFAKSKRESFLEIYGMLKGSYSENVCFSCSQEKGSDVELFVEIINGENRFIIDEVNGWMQERHLNKRHNFKIDFVSETSSKVFGKYVKNNEIYLPSYEESSLLHQAIICSFLQFFNLDKKAPVPFT